MWQLISPYFRLSRLCAEETSKVTRTLYKVLFVLSFVGDLLVVLAAFGQPCGISLNGIWLFVLLGIGLLGMYAVSKWTSAAVDEEMARVTGSSANKDVESVSGVPSSHQRMSVTSLLIA